jgi:hypothetical protein
LLAPINLEIQQLKMMKADAAYPCGGPGEDTFGGRKIARAIDDVTVRARTWGLIAELTGSRVDVANIRKSAETIVERSGETFDYIRKENRLTFPRTFFPYGTLFERVPMYLCCRSKRIQYCYLLSIFVPKRQYN